MKKLRLLVAVCTGLFSLITTSTNAALVDNGGGLIYDTVLDITWAQPDAERNWDDANTWAAGLMLGGVSGWRLPYVSVSAGAGPTIFAPVNCSTATELACRDNELGYMFYHNLSGTSGSSILTSGDPDLALFPSLQSDVYWSGTEFDSFQAWKYTFAFGRDFFDFQGFNSYTWAVHDGNVIPIPPALWLFGSGLLGLIGVARRRMS